MFCSPLPLLAAWLPNAPKSSWVLQCDHVNCQALPCGRGQNGRRKISLPCWRWLQSNWLTRLILISTESSSCLLFHFILHQPLSFLFFPSSSRVLQLPPFWAPIPTHYEGRLHHKAAIAEWCHLICERRTSPHGWPRPLCKQVSTEWFYHDLKRIFQSTVLLSHFS